MNTPSKKINMEAIKRNPAALFILLAKKFRKTNKKELDDFKIKLQAEINQAIADLKSKPAEEMMNMLEGMKGPSGKDGLPGPAGAAGRDGKTPVRGVDYLTEKDIKDLEKRVGRMPVRGKDYWTDKDIKELADLLVKSYIKIPQDGRPGKTPKAGVDFPSKEQISTDIKKLVAAAFPEYRKLISEDVQKIVDAFLANPKAIARALESLNGDDRLDFKALKGRPSEPNIPLYSGRKKRSLRGGGGDLVFSYDLSSLTDGNTKIFTVPYSRKSLGVRMSDFPYFLFENNGFTLNSGRTQLTLTVQNAPSAGSQLAFEYVT